MPATTQQPAHACTAIEGKKRAFSLRLSNERAALIGYTILPGVDFFDEAAIDVLSQAPRDVDTGQVEVVGDDRWRDHRHDVRIIERLEDPIVSFAHPLRSIPDAHYAALCDEVVSLFTSYYQSITLCYFFVTKIKSLASRHCSNDWPGESGKRIRAERASALTRLVVPTTMPTNDTSEDKPRSWDVDKDRPLDDVIAEIAPFATGGAFDARFSLSGEHDDATVRQAVEVDDD